MQQLGEFDWKLIKGQVSADCTVSAPFVIDRHTSLEAFISTSKNKTSSSSHLPFDMASVMT